MKTILFTVLFVFCSCLSFGSDKFKLEDFSIQLEQVTSDPSHIWVSSGYTTVNPQYHTVMGVNEFFSPPFVAGKLNLQVNIQAGVNLIPDNGSHGKGDVGLVYSGGTWSPDRITRYGTYHHLKGGQPVSLAVVSELIPLFGHAGYTEKITIRNRAITPVSLKVIANLNPGNPAVVSLDSWGFSPPQSNTSGAKPMEQNQWANESAVIGIYHTDEVQTLDPGQSLVSTITVMIEKNGQKLPGRVDAIALESQSIDAWQKRLDTYTRNIPSLKSNIEGLDDYYKRSLVSGLVCLWENPAYTLNPFFSTSGIDGGGICTYLWDNAGYIPQTTALMLDTQVMDIAQKMATIDLEKCYAYSLDGTGIGVKYSYSPVAFTGLVSAIFKFITPDKTLFEYNKALILNDEKRKMANNLIDYGFQHNLLEMRGAGWEHCVVSPNAERSWCLKQLVEMGKLTGAGQKELDDWNQQSGRIITAVRNELWDEKKQWFAAVYPDGFRDYVYSIQIYDALRAGVCTPAMEKVLISQLREDAYLGSCGVSSISKSDSIHFEVVDTDWSGGGAYSGDGPQLALTLYEKGYSEIAWDVLKRHFWMGKRFIYFPQEHYCDRPMSPSHKRANVVAGLSGVETVLFGLIGFSPQYNGELYIKPQLVVDGKIDVKGFVYRKHTFDITVTSSVLSVSRDGKTIYEGVPESVKIL
jgi:hypothetical protein